MRWRPYEIAAVTDDLSVTHCIPMAAERSDRNGGEGGTGANDLNRQATGGERATGAAGTTAARGAPGTTPYPVLYNIVPCAC